VVDGAAGKDEVTAAVCRSIAALFAPAQKP
jgi:hypothetical protein